MNMDILKNPIIIGLLVGVAVYMYLKWQNDKQSKIEKNKNKKYKEKKPNILIPLAAAVIASFAVWSYFGSSTTNKPATDMTVENLAKEPLKEDIVSSLTNGTAGSDSVSFHLVGKGINFPHNLPDVFLDMDGFD